MPAYTKQETGNVCLSVYSSLLRTKKWQPSASLSYSDMTHAMSTASDGCSSFNCMSALNDGILNSYTLHTIAFSQWQRPGEAAEAFCGHMEREAEPRLSDRELSVLSLYQNGRYTVPKLRTGTRRHRNTHTHLKSCTHKSEMWYQLRLSLKTLTDT